MQTVILVVSVLVSIALLIIVVCLLYRAARKAQSARALVIRTLHKIVEGRFISIAGRPQWIQIRGERRDNPILLVLHGGPGVAFSAFTRNFQSWERDFTVVQWDQPGAGKSASRRRGQSVEPLTIESMVRDGLEVTEWILNHLGERKLILFATSWGTILGTQMVRSRPDLFWAYVGAGQVINTARSELFAYELAVERARQLGDEQTLDTLRDVGAPPYLDSTRGERERKALGKVGVDTFPKLSDMLAAAFYSPGYSLKDGLSFLRGMQSSLAQLIKPMQAYDAWQLGTTFAIPMFFLQGTLDLYTPARAVQEFYEAVDAPQKALVLWPEEGHFPYFSHPEMVLKELAARVRPLAQPK
jgi:pimeloyl-ACP methyl ester carboxylesterase